MSAAAPLVLRSAELEVVLLPELGARLHRLRAFGHDLLRTPEDPDVHRDDPFFWGAYPMAPWCNRARAERSEVAGRTVDLRSNFADGSAIHGLVSTRPWRVAPDGSLVVEGGDGGEDGWPWPFRVTLVASVEGASLSLDYRLTNRSDDPMPAGLGLHPWLRKPVEVSVPAAAVYPTNTESTADPVSVRGDLDLRTRARPAIGLDGTWTALDRPGLELFWPEARVAGTLAVETPRLLVALATPESVDAVAVEPQTHGPDPLRRLERDEPDAPTMLSPGQSLRLTLRLTLTGAR